MLGATGLFGAHLARALITSDDYQIHCAGRSTTKLNAFCTVHGGKALTLNRDDPAQVNAIFSKVKPFAVIDCAGPFQCYGDSPYKFAQSVINAGAHYLDIADAPDFVEGIAALDALAKSKGVIALSGASTTPALSSAVCDKAAKAYHKLHSIEISILPGNKTDRGLSVMRAILSQVGQPFKTYFNGNMHRCYGWDDTCKKSLHVDGIAPISKRLAALVHTPDVTLFPNRYAVKTVIARAGLEFRLFHRALQLLRWLPRLRVLKNLEFLSPLLLTMASWFKHIGSDNGGMTVEILGQRVDGTFEQWKWDLIAPDGHGPKIPTQPVVVVLAKLVRNEIYPGARPCIGLISLSELEDSMKKFDVVTQTHSRRLKSIFEQALGDQFKTLPPAIQEMHNKIGYSVFTGEASIKASEGWMAAIAGKIAGMPPANEHMHARVSMEAREGREVWVRTFNDRSFKSVLTRDYQSPTGVIQERFGANIFTIKLDANSKELHYPVMSGSFLGIIPIPRFLTPVSKTREYQDELGRCCFDVWIGFSNGKRIAHYQGWLSLENHDNFHKHMKS